MNKRNETIITLIKRAILKSEDPVPTDLDYGALFRDAKVAQILPLVFEGLPDDAPIPDSARNEFTLGVYKSILASQKQCEALQRIEQAFTTEGIDYMLLKGAALRDLYPRSELRMMGDLDILIRVEQYDRIRRVMMELGFIQGKETDHELNWRKGSCVFVELHKRIVPSYNSDFYAYYGDGWRFAKIKCDGTRYAMRPEDELVYLICHLSKHFRDGGIGVRQFVDIWLFVRKHPNLNQKYIRGELKQLHLLRFYDNVLAAVLAWFEDGEGNAATPLITERMLESGAFGAAKNTAAAAALRLTKQHANAEEAKRAEAFRLVFMPYRQMIIKYPVLKCAPVLLPVMWVVRWCDALFLKRKNVRFQRQRLKAINKDVVDTYQNELNLFGLEYHNLKKN